MKYSNFFKMERKWVFPLVVVSILLFLVLFFWYSYNNKTKEGFDCPNDPDLHYKKFKFRERGFILSNKKIDEKYKKIVRKLAAFIGDDNEYKNDNITYQITKDGNFVKITFEKNKHVEYYSLNEDSISDCTATNTELDTQESGDDPPSQTDTGTANTNTPISGEMNLYEKKKQIFESESIAKAGEIVAANKQQIAKQAENEATQIERSQGESGKPAVTNQYYIAIAASTEAANAAMWANEGATKVGDLGGDTTAANKSVNAAKASATAAASSAKIAKDLSEKIYGNVSS